MQKLIESVLSFNPWIEVAVKSLYWRLPFINRALRAVLKKLRRPVTNLVRSDPELLPKLIQQLRLFGVGQEDMLIVHSSMGNLKKLGASPVEIIAALRDLIGPAGTLVMPTFPIYPETATGVAVMRDDTGGQPSTYNMGTTPTWTGIIGATLMRMEGAVRSRHPINSLAALGPEAEAMMAHDIEGDRPLACGIQSPWFYAAQRNAKVIALGTDLAHSLTMIHVAEDAFPEEWPIADWYRERDFIIIDGETVTPLTCRERRPRWAINFAERTLARDLLRDDIAARADIDGVQLHYCESKKLLEYLNARKHQGFVYYFTLQPRRKTA